MRPWPASACMHAAAVLIAILYYLEMSVVLTKSKGCLGSNMPSASCCFCSEGCLLLKQIDMEALHPKCSA